MFGGIKMPYGQRKSIQEIDNRDMDETWLHLTDGRENVLEISREEALKVLESFYVNAAQDEKGVVDNKKIQSNEVGLGLKLQELVNFVGKIIRDCGFYEEDGEVYRVFHDHHEKTPEEDFKESFPELAREMRRGG
jgi:hypothetical protein